MTSRHAVVAIPMVLAVLAAGCGSGSAPALDSPVMSGRRVQSVAVAAAGSVPYRVGAYELVFAEQAGVAHARRAALVVDLFGDRGRVQGFAEWGRAGEPAKTYAVGGWARRRAVDGQDVTVFDLALNGLDAGDGWRGRGDRADRAPVDVRVVVNEGSGDVTLTRRR
jgi:hypothetical protein